MGYRLGFCPQHLLQITQVAAGVTYPISRDIALSPDLSERGAMRNMRSPTTKLSYSYSIETVTSFSTNG